MNPAFLSRIGNLNDFAIRNKVAILLCIMHVSYCLYDHKSREVMRRLSHRYRLCSALFKTPKFTQRVCFLHVHSTFLDKGRQSDRNDEQQDALVVIQQLLLPQEAVHYAFISIRITLLVYRHLLYKAKLNSLPLEIYFAVNSKARSCSLL